MVKKLHDLAKDGAVQYPYSLYNVRKYDSDGLAHSVYPLLVLAAGGFSKNCRRRRQRRLGKEVDLPVSLLIVFPILVKIGGRCPLCKATGR